MYRSDEVTTEKTWVARLKFVSSAEGSYQKKVLRALSHEVDLLKCSRATSDLPLDIARTSANAKYRARTTNSYIEFVCPGYTLHRLLPEPSDHGKSVRVPTDSPSLQILHHPTRYPTSRAPAGVKTRFGQAHFQPDGRRAATRSPRYRSSRAALVVGGVWSGSAAAACVGFGKVLRTGLSSSFWAVGLLDG